MVEVDTLNLINAQSYYGMVRATDFAGNVSEVSISNGITSDHFDMILVSESLMPGSTINQKVHPDTIRYVFNESIDSNVVTMVDNMVGGFTYEVVDSALTIYLNGPFASMDTIYIDTYVDDFSGKDALMIPCSLYVEMQADYNYDNMVDVADLSLFVGAWNDQNLSLELGPVTGTTPHHIPELDNIFDLRDIMAFTRMWHWSHQTGVGALLAYRSVGEDVDFIQDGNELILYLPDHANAASLTN